MSDGKPSSIKPAPWWIEQQSRGLLTAQEVEQRRSEAERLERLYSSNPLYAVKAAKDPWYWQRLADSEPW
jgi:hypothetical protein